MLRLYGPTRHKSEGGPVYHTYAPCKSLRGHLAIEVADILFYSCRSEEITSPFGKSAVTLVYEALEVPSFVIYRL